MQKRTKVALIVFVDQDGDILLNKRADSETEAWELIGGGTESGESAEEAIKREVYEELAYKIDAEKDGLILLDYFDYSDSRLIAQVSCLEPHALTLKTSQTATKFLSKI